MTINIILSHCTYGALAWAPMLKHSQHSSINKQLNKILHIILKTTNTRNVNNLYEDMRVIKLSDIIKKELATFMYKICNCCLPDSIQLNYQYEPRA